VRTLYIALIVAFTAIVVLFKFQNLETVTVTLLSASLTLPVSSLVLAIYVLGMLTGGFVLALVRGWVRGARRRPD
jgi:lipopolysaccharide assembly protein A